MKRTLTLAVFCLTFLGAQAQLADGTKAPDFTITDQEGDTHRLYEYLDSGKTVIIDIFASWCGPCWTLHTNHVLENVYNAYGPDGTNEIMVLAIEGDPATSNADLLGTGTNTVGNWVQGISYPIAEHNTLATSFNLNFYPTIFIIRPSGNVIEANAFCWNNLLDPSQDWVYNAAFRGENDVLANTTQTDRSICGSLFYTGGTQIKNMGTAPLTSATVEMLFNGEVVQTKNWTGNVAEFKTANVVFSATNISSSTIVEFRASLPNGQEDLYPIDNVDGVNIHFPVATTTVSFSITTDFWPEETSWELQDGSGNVLYSNDEFGELQCNTTYNQEFVLENEGCYKFVLVDSWGDGILNGPINPTSVTNQDCLPVIDPTALGAVSLSSDGVVLFDNISYGNGTNVPFAFDQTSSVDPISSLESVAVYPNPAQANVTVEMNFNQNTDVIMQVIDITGKALYTKESIEYNAGNHLENVNVSNLPNGTYFVRLTAENNVNTLKFTILN